MTNLEAADAIVEVIRALSRSERKSDMEESIKRLWEIVFRLKLESKEKP